jgi:phosphatidate cytidylyltransferase
VLRQRVITAVLLLAAFLAAAAAGRSALDASLAILIGAATFEWLRLAKHPTVLCVAAGVVFAGALLAAQVLAAGPLVEEGFVVVLLAVACVAWLGVTALVLRGARRGARLPHWLSTVLAFVLLGAAWLALMRLLDGGVVYMLSVLVIVWLADIAAYFAGRQWGRRKLAPAISPGKTWAGVAGAAAAVTCMAVLLARAAPEAPAFSTLLQQRLGVATALAVLAALVALSIMGDLFESMLKRQVDAKDSSHLLPGHGGVLDRIDALIAVLPAAALLDLWLRR